jgi:L-asparaginase
MLPNEQRYVTTLVIVLILCVTILLLTNRRQKEVHEPFRLYKKEKKTLIIVTGNFEQEIVKLEKIYKNRYDLFNYIASADVQPRDWNELSGIIFDNYLEYNAFIILHTPETLTYTASGLSFILENLDKTVVLTTNAIIAMKFVENYRIPEVLVIDGPSIIRGCRCKRLKNYFFSPNYSLLATNNNGKMELNTSAILNTPQEPMKVLPINTNKKIVVIKLFPGITSTYLQNMIRGQNIYGIILESYENGYIPEDPKLFQLISEIVKTGVIVVSVSQNMGNVIDQSWESAGVILAGTMTTEAIYGKISLIVSHVPNYDNEMVRQLIQTPLRGEI